jgi:uncharacterized repeat protein (TIGR01451 family)
VPRTDGNMPFLEVNRVPVWNSLMSIAIIMSAATFPRISTYFRLVLAVLLTVAADRSASAQEPDLKVTLAARKVTVDAGKETLTAADKAKPGEIIQYEASYQNDGTSAVRHVGAVVPIPAGLTLVANSANPVAAEASLDGKNFSPAPLVRAVKTETGATEDRPVPLSEYRALRWTLEEVSPGTTTTVKLRARVAANGAAQ